MQSGHDGRHHPGFFLFFFLFIYKPNINQSKLKLKKFLKKLIAILAPEGQ